MSFGEFDSFIKCHFADKQCVFRGKRNGDCEILQDTNFDKDDCPFRKEKSRDDLPEMLKAEKAAKREKQVMRIEC